MKHLYKSLNHHSKPLDPLFLISTQLYGISSLIKPIIFSSVIFLSTVNKIPSFVSDHFILSSGNISYFILNSFGIVI